MNRNDLIVADVGKQYSTVGLIFLVLADRIQYRNDVRNTVEDNSSVLFLICTH